MNARVDAVDAVVAVILAAGEGTRMKARKKNKVAYKLAGRPMIAYTVDTIRQAGINRIVVVVKFQEQSVRDVLGATVEYRRQGDRKGTAAALQDGINGLDNSIEHVLVMHGDDSAFYTPELFGQLLSEHEQKNADMTLLSIHLDDPTGIGRILRNNDGHIVGIVEEKVATDQERQIHEVNAGCYCFSLSFLKNRLSEIQENPVSGEYYLTDLVSVALSHQDRVHVCRYPDSSVWFGINTKSQWGKAQRLKHI